MAKFEKKIHEELKINIFGTLFLEKLEDINFWLSCNRSKSPPKVCPAISKRLFFENGIFFKEKLQKTFVFAVVYREKFWIFLSTFSISELFILQLLLDKILELISDFIFWQKVITSCFRFYLNFNFLRVLTPRVLGNGH